MTLLDDALRVTAGWPAGRTLLRGNPAALYRDNVGAHLTASTLVVHPDRERVLLCLHPRVRGWVQLGGHCEPGDPTVAHAALREATEESGIDGLLLSREPIGFDVHPVVCSAGPGRHFDVRYAALAPDGAVERVSAESCALGWYRPDALPAPLADATESLIAPALAWARTVNP